jgi:DNA-directed RNA polymerase subunit RPC12/RpoP
MDEQVRDIPCPECGTPLYAYVQQWSFVRPVVVDNGDIELDWATEKPQSFEVVNYYCWRCWDEFTIAEFYEIVKEEEQDA